MNLMNRVITGGYWVAYSRAYPLLGGGQAEPSGRGLRRSQIALHAQLQQSQLPPRTDPPPELPRRPPCHQQQQTTRQQQPHQIRPSRAVVVAVPRSRAKYCSPSRKHCSGCIRWRYCPTAALASGNEVAKYQGSRCPRPQYSARFTVAAPLERYCAPSRNT